MDIALLRNENERLKEQLAQTQAALAELEEARLRLESIIVDTRWKSPERKSEKSRPDQHQLSLVSRPERAAPFGADDPYRAEREESRWLRQSRRPAGGLSGPGRWRCSATS